MLLVFINSNTNILSSGEIFKLNMKLHIILKESERDNVNGDSHADDHNNSNNNDHIINVQCL